MKRLVNLVVFVLLVGLFTPITGQAAGFGFKDVSTSYTFYDEVQYLSSEDVISGFTDGTFRPNETVTRAQAAIMIGRALGLNGEPRNSNFTDVNSSVTGSGYIASAAEKGIISGFTDGTYRPYQPVTRGQMAIILNWTYTLTTGQANIFNDVSPNMAAYQSILNVAADGIASGYSDGTYRPDQSVTRGQFSAFMARTLEPSFRSLPAMLGELDVTINNSNNSIIVNGISLSSSRQDVINTLGYPKRIDFNEFDSADDYVYLLKNRDNNQELELHVIFKNYNINEIKRIKFEINENVINANWYKDLGEPFAVSHGVTYFYLEGTEQLLMFKPNENNAYVVNADNNFYFNFGMEEKMW